MFWTKLLAIVASLFLLWLLYRLIRHRPQLFSAANLGQTLYTLGWVALFLIAVVGLSVLLLNSG